MKEITLNSRCARAVDMKKRMKIRNDEQITACGWTPFDGIEVQGVPIMTMIRGNIVMENGEVYSKMGFGEYISRIT